MIMLVLLVGPLLDFALFRDLDRSISTVLVLPIRRYRPISAAARPTA